MLRIKFNSNNTILEMFQVVAMAKQLNSDYYDFYEYFVILYC